MIGSLRIAAQDIPMISLGDLLVFVAVLVIVVVFLKVLHSFISHGASRDMPAEFHRQQHEETHAEASPRDKSGKITASRSGSR